MINRSQTAYSITWLFLTLITKSICSALCRDINAACPGVEISTEARARRLAFPEISMPGRERIRAGDGARRDVKNWQDPCALNLTKAVPLVRKVGYSSALIAQGFH